MANRSSESENLARDVAAAFHRLPRCPRALTAKADQLSNIVLELHGRTFTISALVIDRTMVSAGWCESVLTLVLGVPGEHVEDLKRRAAISAALTRAELDVLGAISLAGPMRTHLRPQWTGTCNGLLTKGLLDILPNHPWGQIWDLTDAGRDVLGARLN